LGRAAPPTAEQRRQRGWLGGLTAGLTVQPALALTAESASERRVRRVAGATAAAFVACAVAARAALAHSSAAVTLQSAFHRDDAALLPLRVTAAHVAVGARAAAMPRRHAAQLPAHAPALIPAR
jgi:hypothetical protein